MQEEKKVIVAKTAGFCFGVMRAVDRVYGLADESDGCRIWTYGPIIHNEQVVEDLAARGVGVLESPEELAEVMRSADGVPVKVVIRSHGIGRAEEEALRASGAGIVDATCPFVKRIHRIVRQAGEEGRTVVIVGDPAHPEVAGIRAWCTGDVYITASAEEAAALPMLEDTVIVGQTTFNLENFKKTVEIIKERCYHYHVMDTICNATRERQTEALSIATCVDTMIVIGGKHSSNTQKLYSLCKAECPQTLFIQTVSDLKAKDFSDVRSVGITAGASTPKRIIEEVHSYVRSKL